MSLRERNGDESDEPGSVRRMSNHADVPTGARPASALRHATLVYHPFVARFPCFTSVRGFQRQESGPGRLDYPHVICASVPPS